jgi:two-component system sensor histidine kinase/response regulator
MLTVPPDAPTILAVDDQPRNLLALESVLEPLGHPIVTASSGPEALLRLAEHNVVLILMDVHLPGMDGYEATVHVRERREWRDIPVVFLTAVYDRAEDVHRGYELGAVDYIAKPFDPFVLRRKVQALVALYDRGARAERERNREIEAFRDLFLGAVGHDLRGPLSAIDLASRMILGRPDCGDARHRPHVEKIARASRRMERMIEDILDLTRLECTGRIPITPDATDLAATCSAVLDEVRLARPDRDLELEAEGDVTGFWDADRLARIVSNLVGNAIAHGSGRVRVEARGEAERVVLVVRNEGPPIEARVAAQMFEPFQKGSAAGRGLGLGLYIVREVVRAHGGAIAVASSTEGTAFTVALPRRSSLEGARQACAVGV